MALVAPGVVVALLAGAEERNAAERFQTCQSASDPDAYTLLCDGDHEVPPEWDSADGGMMGKVAY